MNCLLTCYLTGRPDPKIDYSLPDEPLKQWLPDDDDVVKDWIEGVGLLGLDTVIFHDRLSVEFMRKWSRPNIVFRRVKWRTPWTALEERFAIYRDWVSGNECDKVMTTDISDVQVFRDPFGVMTEADAIYVGSEPGRIRDNLCGKWLKDWFADDSLLDRPTLNPGVLGGYRDTFLGFLDQVLSEIGSATAFGWGIDLAAVNRVMYRKNVRHVTGYPLHTAFWKEEGLESGAAIRHK